MEKKQIAKKTIILYVLAMLKKSDEKNPITIINMTHVINSMGISCDRKTVGRNIEYLQEFGYEIKKVKRGGYYLTDNKFNKEIL